MSKIFHKIYLVAQAIILIGGIGFFAFIGFGIFTDVNTHTYVRARNCVQEAAGSKLYLGEGPREWIWYVSQHISSLNNFKAREAEAEKFTKACSSYIAISVSEETGFASVFFVTNSGLKPAHYSDPFPVLGYILAGTATLSVLLFVIRKWIGIVFK